MLKKGIGKSINVDLFAYLLPVGLHEENSINTKGSILEKSPLTWATESIIRYSQAKNMGHSLPLFPRCHPFQGLGIYHFFM
jgi:hypothetical protein